MVEKAKRTSQMGRRDVLSTLAAGIAGVVATPAAASEHALQSAPAPGDSVARLLDVSRREALGVLAEELVPGSRAAGVVDLLDRVMAVESFEEQTRFLNALGAFEREARDRHARGWLEIDESQRLDILRAASTLAPARPMPQVWTKGEPIAPLPTDSQAANLRDHFDRLRDIVARAYYTTEAGMRELGFEGRMAWGALPGCTHSGGDHR